MVEKIAVLVIWFNPNINSLLNILKYSQFFPSIFIIDNSNKNNSDLASKVNNAFYCPNLSNEGIAKAMNKGCQKAKEKGFEWVMTMDQDSSWNSESLSKYINLVENNISDINVSFAPKHSNDIKSVIGSIKKVFKSKQSSDILFLEKVMTSGNIINLSVWEKIGKFNESLFIDEVDHEFCYRLRNFGYKICEFQTVLMLHSLGNVRKTILPRPCKHSGVRLFYIFRNILYIKNNFPQEYKMNGYRKYMIVTFFQKNFELKFRDIKYIFEGIKAFKKNIYGSYLNYLSSK